jgi:hypothetical protein
MRGRDRPDRTAVIDVGEQEDLRLRDNQPRVLIRVDANRAG